MQRVYKKRRDNFQLGVTPGNEEGGAGDGEDRPHERTNATGLIRQVEKRKDKDKGSQRRRKGRSRVAQDSGESRQ